MLNWGTEMWIVVFLDNSLLLNISLCICEGNRSIGKGKITWFFWREKGNVQGMNFCTIRWNALHYEWKYIEWVDRTSFNQWIFFIKGGGKTRIWHSFKGWQQ
jgi:hypothetical protein